ncbi:hypothetical protein M9H77_23052 [Catharanthus roseus]|uniref:Uncharacterized protein n=1 Tax=Catharanthus roseus TaxID=4058 RepID=A0ACC0AS73_CATRO|nr:hypothetical protein M9H77_23052 [Catharanthus roseus]
MPTNAELHSALESFIKDYEASKIQKNDDIFGLHTEIQAIKSDIQEFKGSMEDMKATIERLTSNIYGKKAMGSNPIVDQPDYVGTQLTKPPSTSMFPKSIPPILLKQPPNESNNPRMIAPMLSYAPLQKQPYHQPNIFQADDNFSKGIKLEVADFYGDGHVDVFLD